MEEMVADCPTSGPCQVRWKSLVIDPRTGKYLFIPTSTNEGQRDFSEMVEEEEEEEEKKQVILVRQKNGQDGNVRPTPEGVHAPKAKNVGDIKHVYAESARSSMRSSHTLQSTARGLKKKAKRSALLLVKIGDVVINRGIVAPVARKVARDWKSLKYFRARCRVERRSKTLVWFEDRVKAAKRANEMEQQRQQLKRRNLWRNRLKKERAARQARDVLNEVRSECAKAVDAKYAASLEQEKVQNWFLSSNDGWKMQSLTKNIEEEEDRRWRQKEDAEADKVREGEKQRQAAAAKYLAEYDRSEIITQVCLRTMRRAGFIPAVNAPPVVVEEPPLETDSYLLLRLKSNLSHPIGGGLKKSRGSGGANNLSPDRTSTHLLEAKRHSAELSPSTSREMHPMPSPKASTGVTAVSRSRSVAERGPQVLHSSGPAITRKSKNRGRKQSSGAFEVDLLRFRSVEEIRGWKLGAPGGKSLAADFTNGACPRLKVLRLGWCSLGDRGTQAIMSALGGSSGTRGTGKMLQELQLHGNAITAGGGSAIWEALSTGVLPALRVLDLGNNSLGEAGGREVAHHLLVGRGTWPRLVILDLSKNGMRDRGVEAVIKAVTAPGVALAPDIEYINLRFNRLSRAAMERTACPPGFLVL